MANKSDLDSYLVRIGRKYLENNADVYVKATEQRNIDLKECEYCEKGTPLFEIPFGTPVISIDNGNLHSLCTCEREYDIPIRYCPMCGRKIN